MPSKTATRKQTPALEPRPEPTPEERRAMFARYLLSLAESAFVAVETTATKVARASAWRLENQWSPVGAYFRALAERDIYARVLALTGSRPASRPNAPLDIVDAAEVVRKQLTEDLLSNRFRGGSSHEVSNAADTYAREAAADFVRRVGEW